MTNKVEHLFMFKFNILFNEVSFLQGKPMPNDWLTWNIETPNCITSNKGELGGDILAGYLSVRPNKAYVAIASQFSFCLWLSCFSQSLADFGSIL